MANKSGKNIILFSNRVNIKPLSVNEAWQGKRFKSKKYQTYEAELLYTLPKTEVNWDKQPIELSLIVGLSNMQSDIDNIVKPFVDVLQKKYNFNDKYIFRLIVEKKLVEKGAEFIEFYIKTLIPRHYILGDLEN
jgi:Holliday junction resolvase RusA-like endonuclease